MDQSASPINHNHLWHKLLSSGTESTGNSIQSQVISQSLPAAKLIFCLMRVFSG